MAECLNISISAKNHNIPIILYTRTTGKALQGNGYGPKLVRTNRATTSIRVNPTAVYIIYLRISTEIGARPMQSRRKREFVIGKKIKTHHLVMIYERF